MWGNGMELSPDDRLWQMLQPSRLTEVVDIGANPIDGEPPYAEFLRNGLCRVTGFEPQKEALLRLEELQGPNERYLPYAVGDGKLHTLHVCRASGMTSLLEPDMTNLALFDYLLPLGDVVARQPVETRCLDDLTEINALDFLKIDVQGAELSVFEHGRNKLANAVAIQAEVSFVTLYKNQPSMGDIDLELRRQGFIPHCFAAVKRWPIFPCVINNDPCEPLNQLLEADIVYVRDFARSDLMNDEQLKHLALVAHHCYQSFDLTLRCVAQLEARGAIPAASQSRYMQLLSESD
jgi:FkbM family methyltransferase